MVKIWPLAGLILLVFPALEIWFAVAVVHWFGFQACFLWWLFSIGLAILIFRTQGLALRAQMALLATGQRNPIGSVIWMARRTIAGILLILPGFLSDIAALILLLPWPMPKALKMAPQGYSSFSSGARPDFGSGDSIDGEFQRMNEPRSPLNHDESQRS